MNRPVANEGERGSVLVEVLVSSIVLTIAAIGVFSAFDAATRSSAQERHRAQAHGVAQADLARMRTMRISQLSPTLHEEKTVTIEGTPYKLVSDAVYVNAKTGSDTCDDEESSADYIRIRTNVTWPGMGERPPVTAVSLVAPPNSTAKADSGALIVEVVDGEYEPRAGVPLTGAGLTPFSGETGENGCAIFGGLKAGSYTVTASLPGMIDPDGQPAEPVTTSIVAEATKTLVLEYDEPGDLATTFTTRPAGPTAEPVAANAYAFAVFNTRMDEARAFQSLTGKAEPKLEAGNLFPFDDPYAVYAGACEANNPDPKGESPSDAIASVIVEAGATAEADVELPALRLKAMSGTSASSPGTPLAGAQVVIKDTACPSAGVPTITQYTNEQGFLPEPGLPYSRRVSGVGGYEVCVYARMGTRDRRVRFTGSSVLSVPSSAADIPGGTSRTVHLGYAVSGAESESGKC